MTPYDGAGHGKSTYWTWQAVSTARQNGEECTCWDRNIPRIDVSNDGTYKIAVQCLIKNDGCKEGFPKTDETLTQKFKGFYKG